MTQLDLKTAVEGEIERARQNIDDIQTIRQEVLWNLGKLNALRDEASELTWLRDGVNESAFEFQKR